MKDRLWNLGLFVVVFLMISQMVNAADNEEKKVGYVLPGTEKMVHEVDNKTQNIDAVSTKSFAGGGRGVQNPGTLKGFNPQPDPPGIGGNVKSTVDPDEQGTVDPSPEGGYVSPGEAQGFNPQPDPPGKSLQELGKSQS